MSKNAHHRLEKKMPWCWVGILMLMISCTVCLTYTNDNALAAGAIIGSDSNMGSGGGGGGGGGDGGGPLDENGTSWVYYKASGNTGVDIQTTPRIHGSAVVPAECSLEGRGFWAYGVGGKGKEGEQYIGDGSSKKLKVAYFSSDGDDLTFVLDLNKARSNKKNNTYSTGNGRGLAGVIPWGYKGNTSWEWNQRFTTHYDWELNHHLYHKNWDGSYTEIYHAEKYGSKATVIEQYKIAYRYANNGQEPSGNGLPSTLNFFCYWDGMNDVYSGKADVSVDGDSATTDWSPSDSRNARTVSTECRNDGCYANFNLQLKADGGGSVTNYFVWKTKTGEWDGAWIGTSTASGISPWGTSIFSTSEKLLPGQTVCYSLYFQPLGPNVNTWASVSACASANVTSFEGKSSVTNAVNGSTEWRGSNYKYTAFIDNCDPVSGCKVSFNHWLKRPVGKLGWTEYTVSRTTNMHTGDKAISDNGDVRSGTFNANEAEVSSSGPFTLYPGMVVCETLSFKGNNYWGASSPQDTQTTICASALGDAQPPDTEQPQCDENVNPLCDYDPNENTESDALIDIEVKNNDVSKYGTYRKKVFAKPGDTVAYRASYYPNLQYTYYLIPERMRVRNGNSNYTSIYPTGGVNKTESLARMFNDIVSPPWNNSILVRGTNGGLSYFARLHNDYPLGDITKRTEKNDPTLVNNYKVGVDDVGINLTENVEINYSANRTSKTTPRGVRFDREGSSNNLGTVDIRYYPRSAIAGVPYNYDTDINIPRPEPKDPTNPSDPESPLPGTREPEIAYAGEDKKIDIDIDIKPRYNEATMNNVNEKPYATKTGVSTVKLVVYIANSPSPGIDSWPVNSTTTRDADLCTYYGKVKGKPGDGTNWQCGQFNIRSGDDDSSSNYSFNDKGDMNGNSERKSPTFNVPDLDAGKHVCVSVAIYPANSGAPTNVSPEGSRTWRISESRCYVIAKRPNLQVLGGGIFSAGKLSTATSIKRNLYGVYDTEVASKKNTTVFGSWGEHQVVSLGKTTGFASGASTGYYGNTSRTPISGVGGSFEGKTVDYCVRVPLTFANTTISTRCVSRDEAGDLAKNASSMAKSPKDKDKLIAKFTQNNAYTGVSYQKIEGDATVGATTVGVGMTEVMHATGNVTITGNITYANESYHKLGDIPKMIIYAEKNIRIDCGVNMISAVLIAGRTNDSDGGKIGILDTCPTSFSRYDGNLESEANWKYTENGSNITMINSSSNSNPLRILGTVIANRMSANRTYGAAKGVNSIVPAEVIDYDTSLYLWGARESESSASGRLQTVYLHELSPRY